MKVIEVLESLTKYAAAYRIGAEESIKRNGHMNQASSDHIKQCDIDALLVDFINFVGVRNCVDYALYTCDLTKHAPQENKEEKQANAQQAQPESVTLRKCCDCGVTCDKRSTGTCYYKLEA